MPQVFKVGSYWVYFWANENDPLEPVHVHVCQGAIITPAARDALAATDVILRYEGETTHAAS